MRITSIVKPAQVFFCLCLMLTNWGIVEKMFAQDSKEPSKLETLAIFADTRPGNPAVLPNKRIFVTLSALVKPEINVNEVLPNGSLRPFPNVQWASKPEKNGIGINKTIGIKAMADGTVWILDMGEMEKGFAPQLIAWDTAKNALKKVIVLPNSVLRPNTFAQDFVVDSKRNKIYLADMTFDLKTGRSDYPAMIVIDIDTGLARRVLENHVSFLPGDQPIVINGKQISHRSDNGQTLVHYYGLNPIAIDPNNEWVYYGAMSGKKIYRIKAGALANPDLSDAQLGGSVESYREKPFCDGIAVDAKGNVYVTDVENFAVGAATANGYRTLARDPKLLAWADGFALTADGWLYITVNQLHTLPGLNNGRDESAPPYYLHRLNVSGLR